MESYVSLKIGLANAPSHEYPVPTGIRGLRGAPPGLLQDWSRASHAAEAPPPRRDVAAEPCEHARGICHTRRPCMHLRRARTTHCGRARALRRSVEGTCRVHGVHSWNLKP